MKSTYAKVIVTGGTGFIGAHLSSALAVAGYAVHAFDNFVAGRRAVDKRVKVHEADVRDKGALKRVFKGANYVFHLAALPRVQFSIAKPLATSEVNIMGTTNMLIAARGAGVARVVRKFLKRRGRGKPMTITSDGKQTRDFTHVSDVVRANLLAMKSPKLGKGEALNIGAGHNVSVNTIAHLIGGPTVKIPPRVEPRHN